MMSNSEYVKLIRELNLTEYEAKCYLALFERESLTVVDVVNLTGIPRPNAYEAMRKLLTKGLCTLIPGKVKRYTSSEPQLLQQRALEISQNALQAELDNHERRKQEILDRKENILNKVHKILHKIQPLYNDNRNNDSPLEFIETYKGRLQMLRRYNELIANAREELLSVEKQTVVWIPPPKEEYDQWLEESSNTAKKLIKKGVKIRGIYELSDESERRKWQLRLMEKFIDAGESVRIAKELPMKISTIDSSIVMLMLEDQLPEKPSYTSQIIHHKGMVKTIKMAFETMWAEAEDFRDFIKRENQ
jgi:sugar-specific transcriptional regulator TrmB